MGNKQDHNPPSLNLQKSSIMENAGRSLQSLWAAPNVNYEEIIRFAQRQAPENDEEFLSRLHDDLACAIEEIQSSANHFQEDGEEKLTNTLKMLMKQKNYDVDTESDRRGHADLVIECKALRIRWIAESKIHSGYDHLEEGIRQLVDRYSSGLEPYLGFVVFSKNQNLLLVIKNWGIHLERTKVCGYKGPLDKQDKYPTEVHKAKHQHEGMGTDLDVFNFFVNLYYNPTDKSYKRSLDNISDNSKKRIKKALNKIPDEDKKDFLQALLLISSTEGWVEITKSLKGVHSEKRAGFLQDLIDEEPTSEDRTPSKPNDETTEDG